MLVAERVFDDRVIRKNETGALASLYFYSIMYNLLKYLAYFMKTPGRETPVTFWLHDPTRSAARLSQKKDIKV